MIVYATIPFTLPATATLPPGDPPSTVMTYQWVQQSGPGTSTFLDSSAVIATITAPVAGTYVYAVTVSDGRVPTTKTTSVTVLAYYTSTQNFTASCGTGLFGTSVTRTASASSIISQADANSLALNAATTAATSAIRCSKIESTTGLRILLPNLVNLSDGSITASYSLTINVAKLTSGTALLPASIAYLGATTFTASNLPTNLIADFSSYASANPGAQTFYFWCNVSVTLGSGPVYSQYPSANVFSLDLATPSANVTLNSVRFRDVETPFTSYQRASSALAVSFTDTASTSVQLSLDFGKAFDTFSLNTHGWNGNAFGNVSGSDFDTLILSSLTGPVTYPLREAILATFSPSYNLSDPFDFNTNRFSLTPYLVGSSANPIFILRRGRVTSGGSIQYSPTDIGLRIETSANALDNTIPSVAISDAAISNIAENDAAGIVAGNDVAVSFTNFPSTPIVVSFASPRFSVSTFKWRLSADPYTYLAAIEIIGNPNAPSGIKNSYIFAMGDPSVYDGPQNIFLGLDFFRNLINAQTFTPFSVVFYSATFNATTNQYQLYPDSFPILNNPQTVNGNQTYAVSTFVGFGAYPRSLNGAVTFSGAFSYAEVLYNARVNNGAAFNF